MENEAEVTVEVEQCKGNPEGAESGTLSKRAQKKLHKQQRWEAKKAEKKALMKEQKNKEREKKRLEWDEKLSLASEEEKIQLIESSRSLKKERMDNKSEDKEKKIQRLTSAKIHGQNLVIDLEFSHLMTPLEIKSLSQQIMYCYAVNSRCAFPSHLWLTGCTEEMDSRLSKVSVDRWIIEKQTTSYIESFHDRKDNLVYLTADAETVLDDLDSSDIYIIGGLVDRNRWKGITLKKAQEQGIRSAKLPIDSYLKMSSSQVLTVNQVMEILLKYLETRDWRASFFQVIPQRKRFESNTNKTRPSKQDLGDECIEGKCNLLAVEVERACENLSICNVISSQQQ